MKDGKTLEAFATELNRQYKSKRDFISPANQIFFNQHNEVVVGDYGFYNPNSLFDQQLSTYIKYPYDFYNRSRGEHYTEWSNLVNSMLSTSNEKRLIRTMDGNARALLSDRYRCIDHQDIAEVVFDVLGNLNGWQIESCEITDKKMYIKAISPLTREVSVGDTVQAGIVVSNSEVGLGSVSVNPLIYRLVCKNGAIREDFGVTKRHLGQSQIDKSGAVYELFSDETKKASDKALLLQIRDICRVAVDEAKFELVVNKFKETMGRPITADPVKAVEVFAASAKLNDGERVSVLQHLINGGSLSQWGLINAVTATAQIVDSYDRSTTLERLGGSMIDMPISQWKSISEAGKYFITAQEDVTEAEAVMA